MNESLWSVESLAPFVPTRDWLEQNGLFEPEVHEITEEPETAGPPTEGDDPVDKDDGENTAPAAESAFGFNAQDEKYGAKSRTKVL